MATLYIRGDTWWADYRVGGRRIQRSMKTTQKRVAEEALKAIEGDIVRGQHGIAAKNVTMEAAQKEFLADRKSRNRSSWVKAQEVRLKTFVAATGVKHLDEISVYVIEKYLRKRGDDHGPQRALKDFAVLRAFLRFCERRSLLAQNPIRRVEPPPTPPKKPIRFLSREEIEKVLAILQAPVVGGNGATWKRKEPLYEMAMIALYAGLRSGEIVQLRWEDVDFKSNGGVLHVRVRADWAPKDKESRRIPLHPKLRAILETRKKETGGKGFIFQTANGTHYAVQNLHRDITAVLRKDFPGVNWYTLRHTFASLLAMEGVSLHKIAKFLGHSTIRTTEMHYAGLVPEELHEDIAKL